MFFKKIITKDNSKPDINPNTKDNFVLKTFNSGDEGLSKITL